MSILKVDNIRHNNATSDAITMASDGTCTAKLTSIGGGGLSHRNIIINGAMNVAQYGTSASNTGGVDARSVDRFFAGNPSASAVQTFSQEVDGPAGFYNSAKATCTTALTSYGTGSQSKIEYRIEGTDLAHVQLGTSNAQTLSVSFYVKSNKTGNTAIGLINQNNDRSFVHQYTIASPNTWQRVSFKVVGDTTGTWNKDINIGMRMRWGTFGTNFQTGTFDAWQSGQKMATSNSPINFNSATGDYIQITGVQVELGDTATSFEHRSFADELARCQRYFYKVTGDSGDRVGIGGCCVNSTEFRMNVTFPVTMRALPTIGGTGTAQMDAANDSANFNCSALTIESPPTGLISSLGLQAVTSGMVGGQGGNLRFRSDGSSITFDAEL